MVIEYQRSTFGNQHGELVGETNLWLIRAERSASREKKKYGDSRLPHLWTEEELQRIEEDILAEEVRGATPRYWEDVKVGDELKPVVKGPFAIPLLMLGSRSIASITTRARPMHWVSLTLMM